MKPLRWRTAVVAVSLFVLASCIREPEPPPPPPPATAKAEIYYEEDLQPPPTIRLEIIGLQDTQDDKTKQVTVVGTLINRGDKPTSEVMIKVTALDGHGDSVASIAGVPSTDRIPANGGTARFTAQLQANPAIRSYHVEAVAR